MIYLDYAATTPIDPSVAAAMLPWLVGENGYGNPSSIHSIGRAAREAVDVSRDALAGLIGCQYSEIAFTSSGTEADNLAILGVMLAAPKQRSQLIITTIEHHAVLNAAHRAEEIGFEVTYVPVDTHGIVRLDELERAISDRTALVSVMHANNEIGTIQPIEQIASLAHKYGAMMHTDAVQTAGLLDIKSGKLGCDLVSISAHKIYGPKGAGALYARTGVALTPILVGGTQERERRAGTENVAGIVGFGAAAVIARQRRVEDFERISDLRDAFIDRLQPSISGLSLNGHRTKRLPNNVNISVEGIEGSTLLMNLDRRGVCAASGAACSSGSIEPSHVLKAIGLSNDRAAGGVRFSLGRGTTPSELDEAAEITADIVKRLRRFHNVA